jgi:hypothetical protein
MLSRKMNIRYPKALLAVYDSLLIAPPCFVSEMAMWSRTPPAVIMARGRNRKEALQWLNLKNSDLIPPPFWRAPA